ncbi:Hypothetical predicted protein [Paramuricea clavata]|uniref:Uncharacterized protein n=1 Tax=Paramuricea clavata TaxID=317549 RepID=A0A6S7GB55_PARCT|nr:Hypothetical predicted protein [Paramuricea clavata]
MSKMNKSEKELYQAVHAMTFTDIRNELQLHSLPITFTRTSCTQSCLSTNDNNWRRNLHQKLFDTVRRTRSIKYTKRTRSITKRNARSEGQQSKIIHRRNRPPRRTNIGHTTSKHLAEWQEQFLQVLTETQVAANKSPVIEKPCVKEKGQPLEASIPFNKMSYCDDEEISQLGQKQKFVGTSIEVLMHEMHKFMTDAKSQRQLDKALEWLKSLEK